ncbi:restriction endonuclease subunit S [Abyssibacter profundi]|uniref:Restriction endonuclease n=1 Tax=Abyssibacter profundi TaxID=2182787 RepID=A0A363UJI5_9GAMM|nr:restriction endonuclease subunit S [Abyssibacter profundi]PWN55574.1 restriction endonuclease [Abyssibacter profundi]
MSVEKLITEHMDVWANSITPRTAGRGGSRKLELTGVKRLRELILELAVRGRLVPQGANRRSGEDLRIELAEARKQAMKTGGGKNQKPLKPVEESEKEFPEPNGWAWLRLSDVGRIVGGGTPKSKDPSCWADEGVKWLTPADLYGYKSKYISAGRRDISQKGLDTSSAVVLPVGTVLFSSRAPIGYVAIASAELATNQGFKSCVPFIDGMSEYLYYFLMRSARQIDSEASGTTFKEVSGATVARVCVPLPPLEEQHRIVQKVDELMALCDRLEQQTGDQIEAHERLVDTLLETLTRAENATELAENWARVEVHFDTLFTTEHSIDRLKQTILQLAVMGRLVRQTSLGKSAAEFLHDLRRLRDEAIAAGRIKKSKLRSEAALEEVPFNLPESWAWCRLPELGELARGKSKHRPRNDPALYEHGKFPMVQTGDVARANRAITTHTALYNEKGVAQSKLWRRGTLCITIAANIGDTGILGFDACFPDSVVGFTPFHDELKTEYVEYFLRTAKRKLTEFAPSTAQKNINLEVLESLLVPLPPPEELGRIVLRVDELMAMCDRLKSDIRMSSDSECKLANAIFSRSMH